MTDHQVRALIAATVFSGISERNALNTRYALERSIELAKQIFEATK